MYIYVCLYVHMYILGICYLLGSDPLHVWALKHVSMGTQIGLHMVIVYMKEFSGTCFGGSCVFGFQ